MHARSPASVAERDALAAVGPRLRTIRTARGVTLAAVAAETGISTSTLSRLESGGRKPTLELLLPLARAYGVPLDELVNAPASGDPRIHIRPLRRDSQVILPLSSGAGGVHAFKHVYRGARPGDPAPRRRTHPGHEWFTVLSGRIRLLLGDAEHLIERGEAVEFDTLTPHWFGPADQRPAEVLSLFGADGERVHVTAI
ncbi:helix-turn-helix domain-containing protein [Arenivirga flava]|uniref:DNA-binding protein n=1 Tax=Arenivirga flava TaxID=1930060 RepID=A0AA37XBB2_9MICO|nr:XRE family transcriptional regulator [Arenivirga flava]GMA27422.1 DNA-binding protein [Arenivirga flava]